MPQPESAKQRIKAKREFVATWKAKRGCAWCQENDPIVLELDHIDRSTKNPELKHTKDRSWRKYWIHLSWDDLRKELEKCQVLCANCHRRKTWAETH